LTQARGRVAVAKYGRLKTDTIRAQIVYCGSSEKSRGATSPLGKQRGDVRQTTPKALTMQMAHGPHLMSIFSPVEAL
jgi:hypothetical protein